MELDSLLHLRLLPEESTLADRLLYSVDPAVWDRMVRHRVIYWGYDESLHSHLLSLCAVIQLAKLSGFSNIVATASPRNEAFLKSLGATHVLDRNASPSALTASISQIISGGVDVVYDAVSTPDTQQLGYDILSNGGSLVLVSPPIETVVETKDKTVISVRGLWGDSNRSLAVEFYRKLTELLGDGSIKPNHYEVIPGGLNGVVSGLERLKKNEVSATKLLIRPKETV
ncbi:hypothetical protein H0H93_000222 [Arthromyces matolae]|nr:hypothetical protein H0H93_000222 [Arthromyces matolae]